MKLLKNKELKHMMTCQSILLFSVFLVPSSKTVNNKKNWQILHVVLVSTSCGDVTVLQVCRLYWRRPAPYVDINALWVVVLSDYTVIENIFINYILNIYQLIPLIFQTVPLIHKWASGSNTTDHQNHFSSEHVQQ